MAGNRICCICAAAASHYCAQDDAFLCPSCNVTIHSANVLASRHNVMAIANQGGQQAQLPEPDATSEASASPAVKEESSPLSLTGTEGVVPDMGSLSPVPNNGNSDLNEAANAWGKDFDLFDLDNGWLDKLDNGFDFTDVMDEAGLVPSMSSSLGEAAPQFGLPSHLPESHLTEQQPLEDNWDMLVPSIPMPFMTAAEEEAEQQHQPQQLLHFQPVCAPVSPIFQMPAPIVKVTSQQARINRQERIAVYREKRKNLKFEKTIRYATRKAYAEVRPRIKGRFATREEVLAMKAGTFVMPEEDAVVPCL